MENLPAVSHPPSPPASETDDEEILDNIDGCIHILMRGFIKKYFGNFPCVLQDDP